MLQDENLNRLREIFGKESSRRDLKGIFGVASFRMVHDSLLLIQRERLKEIVGRKFKEFLKKGSLISIAYAYPMSAIDAIAIKNNGTFDIEAWNHYAEWYKRLNDALNETALMLANKIEGTAIPATLAGLSTFVNNVEDYYPLVISHRVVAELSGVGWRGKNELIINPIYGCAIRLASIVTDLPLEWTSPISMTCGNCRACLDVCPYLNNKSKLENYREQCRKYIIALGLDGEVCGKCIKACIKEGMYKDTFSI